LIIQIVTPPGATISSKTRARSRWREFVFGFHEIQRAIEPHGSLKQMLEGWQEIKKGLAESPRKRKTREQKMW
jgi:hypothetical protein